MLQVVKKYSFLTTILLLVACERYDVAGFVSPPSKAVDARFEQSLAWQGLCGESQINVPADEYDFYVATDIHTSNSVENITAFMTQARNDASAYFSLVLGDLVDCKGAFPLFVSALKYNALTQARNDTVFTTVGNHDLFFDQWDDYAHYFGAATYSFVVKTPNFSDLFVAIDSASGTLGCKQLQWLKRLLEERRSAYRWCVVFTHTNLFKTDLSQFPSGNLLEDETYELTDVFAQNDVDLVLTGHDHYREELTYKNVRYVSVDALKDGLPKVHYLVVHSGKKLSYDFVPLSTNK